MKYQIIEVIRADQRWATRQGLRGWIIMAVLSLLSAIACRIFLNGLIHQVVALAFCLFLSLQFFWYGSACALRAAAAGIYVTRQGQLVIRHMKLHAEITIAPQEIQLTKDGWLLADKKQFILLPLLAYPNLPQKISAVLADLREHPDRPALEREI